MEPRRQGRRPYFLLSFPLIAAGCATESPEVRMTEPPVPPPLVMPKPPPVPAAAVRTLGQTVEGRPMTLYLFENPSNPATETVLILGGIHGNEGSSAGV